MSVALTQTIESLHITAARKLQQLIETEKDANLLARLISIASRFKTAIAKATPIPPPPTTLNPTQPETPEKPPAARAGGSHRAQPPQPYTEEEFGNLVVRFGEDAAARMNAQREGQIAEFTSRNHNPASSG